jgi:hypothetical protein
MAAKLDVISGVMEGMQSGASCTGKSWVGLEGKVAGVWGPRRPPVGSRGCAPGGGRGGEAPRSCGFFLFLRHE